MEYIWKIICAKLHFLYFWKFSVFSITTPTKLLMVVFYLYENSLKLGDDAFFKVGCLNTNLSYRSYTRPKISDHIGSDYGLYQPDSLGLCRIIEATFRIEMFPLIGPDTV